MNFVYLQTVKHFEIRRNNLFYIQTGRVIIYGLTDFPFYTITQIIQTEIHAYPLGRIYINTSHM
jgi:hypothetical protein